MAPEKAVAEVFMTAFNTLPSSEQNKLPAAHGEVADRYDRGAHDWFNQCKRSFLA